MSMVNGKMGIMAAVMATVGAAFRGVGFGSVPVGGFNNQSAVIPERRDFVDRHISPALIRRRMSKTSNYKKKTNRLHTSRKAKIRKRRAA